MRDIKTQQTDNAPRVRNDAARAPNELVRRSLISTRESAERQLPGEQPEPYAEERVERTAEDAVYRAGSEAAQRGKPLAAGAGECRRHVGRKSVRTAGAAVGAGAVGEESAAAASAAADAQFSKQGQAGR